MNADPHNSPRYGHCTLFWEAVRYAMTTELTIRTSWTSILLRAIEVWLVISVLEVLHGIVRTVLLEPLVGDFRARQIGVLTGSALVLITAFLFRRWIGAERISTRLCVGLIWVVTTVAFEVLLGRLVLDLPWERILSDYDVLNGGLMPLGLFVMLISPTLVARLSS
jgi:hypothetical protein